MSTTPPATLREALADMELRRRMYDAGYTNYTIKLFYGEPELELVETYRFRVTLKATGRDFLGKVFVHCQDHGEFMWLLFNDDITTVSATTEAIFACPSGAAMGWSTSGYGDPERELKRLVTEIDPYATVRFVERRYLHPDEVAR